MHGCHISENKQAIFLIKFMPSYYCILLVEQTGLLLYGSSSCSQWYQLEGEGTKGEDLKGQGQKVKIPSMVFCHAVHTHACMKDILASIMVRLTIM